MTKIVRYGTGPRRRGPIIGLIVLALVTAALIYFALTSADGDSGPSSAKSAASSSAKPTPKATAASQVAAPSRLLAIRPEGGVFRTHLGKCPSNPATAEASFNSGETWEPGNIAPTNTAQILSMNSGAGRLVQMVGLDADCEPQAIRSYIGGVSWEVFPSGLNTAWFLNPSDPDSAQILGVERKVPCEVAQLAGSQRAGIVLCRDRRVFLSGNAGERWSKPREVPQAAAVAVTAEGFLVASVNEPECEGVRVRSVRDGDISHPSQCLKVDGRMGYLAIAGSGPVLAVWAADELVYSQDRGDTWEQ